MLDSFGMNHLICNQWFLYLRMSMRRAGGGVQMPVVTRKYIQSVYFGEVMGPLIDINIQQLCLRSPQNRTEYKS